MDILINAIHEINMLHPDWMISTCIQPANNRKKTGIRIQTSNNSPKIIFYPEQHENTETFVKRIINNITSPTTKTTINTNFQYNPKKIRPWLVNKETNRHMEIFPHRNIADMIILYRYEFTDVKTALITNDIIKVWNITEKDLYEASQKYIEDNTIIKTLDNVLSKLLPDLNITKTPTLLVTNRHFVHGAANITNEKVRKNILAKLNTKDAYVLPSSIHETLILPTNAGISLKDLKDMVKDINNTAVCLDDKLTDSVYIITKDDIKIA